MIKLMKTFFTFSVAYILSFSNPALASGYTALINCGQFDSKRGMGADYVDHCFYDSDLKITINKISNIYSMKGGIFQNYPQKAGYAKNGALAINLGNDFSIRAQNSSNYDILTIRIFDDAGEMVFQDQASKYQSIYVKH